MYYSIIPVMILLQLICIIYLFYVCIELGPDFRRAMGTPNYFTLSEMWGRTSHYWLHLTNRKTHAPAPHIRPLI
jgi:hypothetical protein